MTFGYVTVFHFKRGNETPRIRFSVRIPTEIMFQTWKDSLNKLNIIWYNWWDPFTWVGGQRRSWRRLGCGTIQHGDSSSRRYRLDVTNTRIVPSQTRQSCFADIGYSLVIGTVTDNAADISSVFLADGSGGHVTFSKGPEKVRQSCATIAVLETLDENHALRSGFCCRIARFRSIPL